MPLSSPFPCPVLHLPLQTEATPLTQLLLPPCHTGQPKPQPSGLQPHDTRSPIPRGLQPAHPRVRDRAELQRLGHHRHPGQSARHLPGQPGGGADWSHPQRDGALGAVPGVRGSYQGGWAVNLGCSPPTPRHLFPPPRGVKVGSLWAPGVESSARSSRGLDLCWRKGASGAVGHRSAGHGLRVATSWTLDGCEGERNRGSPAWTPSLPHPAPLSAPM